MATEITNFRLDVDLKKRLQDAADDDDRPVSRLVHQAIAEYLDRRDAALAPPVGRPAKRRK